MNLSDHILDYILNFVKDSYILMNCRLINKYFYKIDKENRILFNNLKLQIRNKFTINYKSILKSQNLLSFIDKISPIVDGQEWNSIQDIDGNIIELGDFDIDKVKPLLFSFSRYQGFKNSIKNLEEDNKFLIFKLHKFFKILVF